MANKELWTIVRAIGHLANQMDDISIDSASQGNLQNAMNILHECAEALIENKPVLIWYLIRWSARYSVD